MSPDARRTFRRIELEASSGNNQSPSHSEARTVHAGWPHAFIATCSASCLVAPSPTPNLRFRLASAPQALNFSTTLQLALSEFLHSSSAPVAAAASVSWPVEYP